MVDIVLTVFVVAVLAMVLAGVTRRYPRSLQPWVWFAFAEYMACATVQWFFGADANLYRALGAHLSMFLSDSFGWAAPELVALLLHRPSAFDSLVVNPGTNTGSMFAATAWLFFFTGGSPYAVQATVAGLSMFGALGIYRAGQDLCPNVSPVRLFVGTVVFPSVAFWTSNLHKESFCLMGMGLLLAAARAMQARRLRALVYAPAGAVLVAMFRPPAIPPLLVGFAVFFVLRRLQKTRGAAGKLLIGPVYIAAGIGVTAVGVVVLGKIVPALALEQIVESVATQQAAWSLAEGGSTFAADDAVETSLGGQLLAAPLGFVNGLFRPQLFDVRSAPMLVSALEMTVILWFVVRTIRRHGAKGILYRIQQNPFLAMCTVVTIIGCTIVGLTTRNMGSMARYRAPFLPFYGVWLAALSEPAFARKEAGAGRPARSSPRTRPLPARLRARLPLRHAHRRDGNPTAQGS